MKYIKKYEEHEDKSSTEELDFSDSNLTKLPDLSKYTNLKVLSCSNNELTSLPELPKILRRLYCDGNQLTSIPKLPNNLTYLNCSNNQLTSLPELPDTLFILYCDSNQLPFEDLIGYGEWYEDNKQIIETEGLEYAYQLSQDTNKYNL